MKMISYIESADGIQANHLQGFFVGWPSPPSPDTHLKLLQNSDFIVLAVEAESQRVVGFITAISDHVLSAYISLLEVLPDYQRQGIGQELVRRLLARLEHLYMIDLLCDVDVQPFYEALGMHKAQGMLLRHYHNQAGLNPNEPASSDTVGDTPPPAKIEGHCERRESAGKDNESGEVADRSAA